MKLMNNVHRTTIGYYKEGVWEPVINFNFRLHTYINDAAKSLKGWIGVVMPDEEPKTPFEIFFPLSVLESYTRYIHLFSS